MSSTKTDSDDWTAIEDRCCGRKVCTKCQYECQHWQIGKYEYCTRCEPSKQIAMARHEREYRRQYPAGRPQYGGELITFASLHELARAEGMAITLYEQAVHGELEPV